jgi:hypothetical protein
VFGRFRQWRAERKERRFKKYADDLAWMDRDQLEKLRRQQSPMRRGTQRRM